MYLRKEKIKTKTRGTYRKKQNDETEVYLEQKEGIPLEQFRNMIKKQRKVKGKRFEK